MARQDGSVSVHSDYTTEESDEGGGELQKRCFASSNVSYELNISNLKYFLMMPCNVLL